MSVTRVRKIQQRGDTIVEVLIAIAVVSIVLTGAFLATNKNTQSIQDAQERSQALKLAESQIEVLRSRGSVTAGQCFDNHGNPQPNSGAQGANPCIVSSAWTMASATQQPAYSLSFTSGSTYAIQITWSSLTSTGQSNLVIYYRP